jgi:uncharacterized protein DUF3891
VILRPDPRGVLAIGLPAHAWLSGQMADAWRWPFQPRAEVCLAALQHDIGMAAWDANPLLDPASGLPYSFTSMPRAMHVSLWSRAARLMEAQSGYAALLVSLHGTGLYERYVSEQERSADPVRSYLEGERAYQRRQTAALGLDAAAVSRNAALVRCWDWLSLFVCTASGATSTFTAAPTDDGDVDLDARRVDGDPAAVAVAPWPFRGDRLPLAVEGRMLTGGYKSQEQLDGALAEAPVEIIRIELRSG